MALLGQQLLGLALGDIALVNALFDAVHLLGFATIGAVGVI